jgi:hypothetical protein
MLTRTQALEGGVNVTCMSTWGVYTRAQLVGLARTIYTCKGYLWQEKKNYAGSESHSPH